MDVADHLTHLFVLLLWFMMILIIKLYEYYEMTGSVVCLLSFFLRILQFDLPSDDEVTHWPIHWLDKIVFLRLRLNISERNINTETIKL